MSAADASLGAAPPDHWCRSPGWLVVQERISEDGMLHINWRCGCGFAHHEIRRVTCADAACDQTPYAGGTWCEDHLMIHVKESRRRKLAAQRVQHLVRGR